MMTNASPNSRATKSPFHRFSNHIWVSYPAGLVRQGNSLFPDNIAEPWLCFLRGCRSVQFVPAPQGETSMQLGHLLVQESRFVCTVKGVGDISDIGDIYVEIVIDTNCRLAFAKVYRDGSAMNAVDLLQERVVPFYKLHGVAIERIITPKTREYCGLTPVHPYETFLAIAHIDHQSVDRKQEPSTLYCEELFKVLGREFFEPMLQKSFHLSVDKLQGELDLFMEGFNHKQPASERGMKDRSPFALFQDSAKA
jgi:hypothetical protein